MKMYALFEGTKLIGGPQSVNPGNWIEVEVENVLPGTLVEWDLTSIPPKLKKKTLTPEELASRLGQDVKTMRTRLLQESDWTDTASASERLGSAVYGLWQEYRQALRDVTEQAGYPAEVVWPEPPSA